MLFSTHNSKCPNAMNNCDIGETKCRRLYSGFQWIVLPSVKSGTALNRGTTEWSSFEFGSSLKDSCVTEENRAINHRTVETIQPRNRTE